MNYSTLPFRTQRRNRFVKRLNQRERQVETNTNDLMKEPKTITFRHAYYKLAKAEFTTIRGRAQFKLLKVGQTVPVETPVGKFTATIINLQIKRVSGMTLDFLKADAEYPGFAIRSHADFVALLNSFRSPAWTQVQADSELTVITLRKD